MPITVQMGEGTLVQNRALSTMERVAPSVTKRTRPVAAVLAVIAAAALIAVACGVHYNRAAVSELLSPLQVGRYAVRAERQSGDYDSKAERQIAFATDSDNAATSERELAAKEEKRARESAYLAADVKSRIDKILEAGRDQVGNSAAGAVGLTAVGDGFCGRRVSSAASF